MRKEERFRRGRAVRRRPLERSTVQSLAEPGHMDAEKQDQQALQASSRRPREGSMSRRRSARGRPRARRPLRPSASSIACSRTHVARWRSCRRSAAPHLLGRARRSAPTVVASASATCAAWSTGSRSRWARSRSAGRSLLEEIDAAAGRDGPDRRGPVRGGGRGGEISHRSGDPARDRRSGVAPGDDAMDATVARTTCASARRSGGARL